MTTEAQMLEEEFMFDALQSARIGMCVSAADGRILTMTPLFATKLGLNAVDVLGRNVRVIVSDKLLIPRFDALIGFTDDEVSVEVPVAHGERLAVLLLHGRTLRRPHRGPFRVLTVVEVADFGVSTGRLNELHRRLEALNTALVVADRRLPDMPIVLVNSRFKALTGYSPEEVIGRNCRFLQGEDRQQPALQTLREAIANNRSGYAVLRNYRRNGEPFLNELLISPILDVSGTVTHYVALQRDISARDR